MGGVSGSPWPLAYLGLSLSVICPTFPLLPTLGEHERERPAARPHRGQEGCSDSKAGQPEKGEAVILSPSPLKGLFGGNTPFCILSACPGLMAWHHFLTLTALFSQLLFFSPSRSILQLSSLCCGLETLIVIPHPPSYVLQSHSPIKETESPVCANQPPKE